MVPDRGRRRQGVSSSCTAVGRTQVPFYFLQKSQSHIKNIRSHFRKEGKKLNKQALTEGITLSENNAASGAGLSDNFFGDAVDNVCPNCVLGGSLSRRL